MSTFKITANHYQTHDADYSLKIPAEGYKGWTRDQIELSWDHTALVIMHAWDIGSYENYPGMYRKVEYIPRAKRILAEVFPRIIPAVRTTPLRIYHVVGGNRTYYKKYAGYKRTMELLGEENMWPSVEQISDIPGMKDEPVRKNLHEFKAQRDVHNRTDFRKALDNMKDFPAEARPEGNESIAENDHQLFTLCREDSVNHLIYIGFAINACLMSSRGGMIDMRRRGLVCSTIREAVTACEYKETARDELCKEISLIHVGSVFGFVFGLDDFLNAMRIRK